MLTKLHAKFLVLVLLIASLSPRIAQAYEDVKLIRITSIESGSVPAGRYKNKSYPGYRYYIIHGTGTGTSLSATSAYIRADLAPNAYNTCPAVARQVQSNPQGLFLHIQGQGFDTAGISDPATCTAERIPHPGACLRGNLERCTAD